MQCTHALISVCCCCSAGQLTACTDKQSVTLVTPTGRLVLSETMQGTCAAPRTAPARIPAIVHPNDAEPVLMRTRKEEEHAEFHAAEHRQEALPDDEGKQQVNEHVERLAGAAGVERVDLPARGIYPGVRLC